MEIHHGALMKNCKILLFYEIHRATLPCVVNNNTKGKVFCKIRKVRQRKNVKVVNSTTFATINRKICKILIMHQGAFLNISEKITYSQGKTMIVYRYAYSIL